jgi:hypothetical protein
MNTKLWRVPAYTFMLAVATACTTSAPRGTEVTRFHLDKPIAAQTIRLEPADATIADSLEYRSYASSISTELSRLGFQISDQETAGLIATVTATRGLQQKAPKRSAVSVGVGAGSYGSSGGVSGGVSFPLGGATGGEIYVSRLEVQFIDRTKNAVVWEGSATRETVSVPESPTVVMQKLAAALFQDFPGVSGHTVMVKDEPE